MINITESKKTSGMLKAEMLYGRYANKTLMKKNVVKMDDYIQHGNTSTLEHCISVAKMSLKIAEKMKIKYDAESLIRGALLHDYFLYDWHDSDKSHKLHGFKHAKTALANASRDFKLNEIERDIICKHMFPLNLKPPKYRESYIVCLADKICSLGEIFRIQN